jgi:hypothetical protein
LLRFISPKTPFMICVVVVIVYCSRPLPPLPRHLIITNRTYLRASCISSSNQHSRILNRPPKMAYRFSSLQRVLRLFRCMQINLHVLIHLKSHGKTQISSWRLQIRGHSPVTTEKVGRVGGPSCIAFQP